MTVPSSKAPAAVPPAPSTEQVLSLVMAHCPQHTKLTALQFVSRQMRAAMHTSQAWTNTTTLSLNYPHRTYSPDQSSAVAHFNFGLYHMGVTMKQRSKLEPISDLLYLMPNVRSVRLGVHLPFVIQTTVMDRLAQWKQLQHVAIQIHTEAKGSANDFYQHMFRYIADNRGLFPKMRLSLKLENDGRADRDNLHEEDDKIPCQALVETLQLALCTGCAIDCLNLHIDLLRSNWAPPHCDPVNDIWWSIVPSFSNATISHLKCQPISVLWLQQVINELKPGSLEQITFKAAHCQDTQVGVSPISTRRFLRGIQNEQLSQVTECAIPYWPYNTVASDSVRGCAYLCAQIAQILEKMPKLVMLDLGPSGHYKYMDGAFAFEWASFKEVIDLLLQRSLHLEHDVQVWIDHCIHFASDLDELLANLHETYKEEYCVATKLTWHKLSRTCWVEGLRLSVTLLHARTGHTLKLSCI